MTAPFPAFRVYEEDGRISGRRVMVGLDELSEGAVVIKAAYSSVNYKDALAATGAGKIMRRFPLTGGIDVSGTVASSSDARSSRRATRCSSPDTTSASRTTAATRRTCACRLTGSSPCRKGSPSSTSMK